MKNLALFLVVLTVAVLFGAHDLIAQPPPPALPSDVTQAPIDGGLVVLALSGGAYALKKIRSLKK
jgi:hypothetical protein